MVAKLTTQAVNIKRKLPANPRSGVRQSAAAFVPFPDRRNSDDDAAH